MHGYIVHKKQKSTQQKQGNSQLLHGIQENRKPKQNQISRYKNYSPNTQLIQATEKHKSYLYKMTRNKSNTKTETEEKPNQNKRHPEREREIVCVYVVATRNSSLLDRAKD